ncbi:beta-lactamase-like protein [Irpex rosettiformis]|uniref:Beta-lactamase-like protein n=1 Tax=Irpex rosettiformis TaxID=378272 RepID=A0ACB8U4P3_9APHY|nr:beta-lactamase-like protein [Irpex rosettiformis]
MAPISLSALNITFLGTASAQPSTTRNHSSLALRLGGDVWLFDCGEATQHQIQKSAVKMGKISKIFITHTHGDHIFGLVPLLASRLNGAGGTAEGVEDPRVQALPTHWTGVIEIYGPPGTRDYVRSSLACTHTILGGPYVVHELHAPSSPSPSASFVIPPNPAELPGGRNIPVDEEIGTWRHIFTDEFVQVSAAPIAHSVPCVGYVVEEKPVPGKMDPKLYIPHLKRTKTPMSVLSQLQQGGEVILSDGTVLEGPRRRPGRKIVILGDTYDAGDIMANLATDADVLIHEATNAHLPGVDTNTKGEYTYEGVEERSRSRGHSTPQVAGRFATRVRAKKLYLNHFSARYAGNDDVDEKAGAVMAAIRELAETEFKGPVICARDLMSVDI